MMLTFTSRSGSPLLTPVPVHRKRSAMARQPRLLRKAALTIAAAITLAGSLAAPARAAGTGPCDIYASGGTPCVAAHSTTRALYGSYSGALYQVRRSSDNATRDIGLLSAGGYV